MAILHLPESLPLNPSCPGPRIEFSGHQITGETKVRIEPFQLLLANPSLALDLFADP